MQGSRAPGLPGHRAAAARLTTSARDITYSPVELVSIDHFGGWKLAQKEHFASGGVFDQITAGNDAK